MIIKLYSNRKEFEDVCFHDGLNVVLGEIHLEKDREKDTHNLGKSTLCQLLDFCLLKKRDNHFFLFSHKDLFQEYIFYLEIQLKDGRYLTIRRAVAEPSKVWLLVTADRGVDGRDLEDDSWTHGRLPFERAKMLLDGLLSYEALPPWDYRKILTYLFRGQDAFAEVFRPPYRGKDRDWKPFLLHVMGFDSNLFERQYELEADIDRLKEQERHLVGQLSDGSDDSGEIDALIAIKQREVDELQSFLNEFELEPHDQAAVRELVDEVDVRSIELNDRLLFSTVEAERLFEEAGVLFEGQIKRSFDQLLAFNADITEERRSYLAEDLEDARAELKEIEGNLQKLDRRRSGLLGQLESEDAITKYKSAPNSLVERKTELEGIKHHREQIRALQATRREIAAKKNGLTSLDMQIQDEIDRVSSVEQTGLFSRLRREFDDIVFKVISEGSTYKKLLCVAFDLALLIAHDGNGFPDFVFHDDVFAGLDKRKKENLRDVMRACGNKGVQQIVTAIDSELPASEFFDEGEITLRLHDKGDSGRLFKIPEW